MTTNVVELYISASVQAKDYPHLTLVVPDLIGPGKSTAYVARIVLNGKPSSGVTACIRRRIEAAKVHNDDTIAVAQTGA